MLTITESAWKRISQLHSSRPGITAFRLTHQDGRVKCHRGVQKKRDRIVEHAGCPTLLLAPAVADDLSGQTLDAPETDHGRRLRLKHGSR